MWNSNAKAKEEKKISQEKPRPAEIASETHSEVKSEYNNTTNESQNQNTGACDDDEEEDLL